MSYVKVPKLTANCGIGYQDVLELRDGLEQMRDDYLLEHSAGASPSQPDSATVVTPYSLYPTQNLAGPSDFGRHNWGGIARAVATVDFQTGQPGSITPRLAWCSSFVINSVARVGVGIFYVAITGIQNWRAKCDMAVTSASQLRGSLVLPVRLNSAGAGASGFYVYTYDNGALADSLPFSLVVWGTLATLGT